MTATEQRNQITELNMQKITEALDAIYDEVCFTGDNLTTRSFVAGEVNGEPVYGSIKFTLHKSNWNLDDEIDKYYAKVEERELKAKVTAQKKAEKERKLALQKEKAAKRQAAAELDKVRTQKSIESLKAQLKEDNSVEE